MAEPTPAQIEAAARAVDAVQEAWSEAWRLWSLDEDPATERTPPPEPTPEDYARAALTAAAQVHQTDEDRHGPWLKDAQRYTDGCDEDRPHSQPAPEADEREALGEIIWTTSRADESTISATGANIVADAILAAGFRRSQPAPRTVSAADYDEAWLTFRDTYARCGTFDGSLRAAIAALGITVEVPRG